MRLLLLFLAEVNMNPHFGYPYDVADISVTNVLQVRTFRDIDGQLGNMLNVRKIYSQVLGPRCVRDAFVKCDAIDRDVFYQCHHLVGDNEVRGDSEW